MGTKQEGGVQQTRNLSSTHIPPLCPFPIFWEWRVAKMATVGSANFAFQKPMGDIMDTMSKFYRVYGGNLHWAPWRTLWGMPSSWLVSEAHVKTLPIHLKMATCDVMEECPEVIQCHSVLKGAEYAHCGKFSMKKLRVSSFVHFPIFKGC